MKLVWKLLRQHISWPQFVGFFFANLFGMTIVLLGYQLYCDILPIFTANDSFLKADYLVVSKKIGMANALGQQHSGFSKDEIADLQAQPFVKGVGQFTSTAYKAEATMGVSGMKILNSELFFESVPDPFVDVSLDNWHYTQGDSLVPVILPRSYIAMYNFGFAQNHSLPKINEGLVGMIDLHIRVQGKGGQGYFKGKVIGFSSKLNTILVPQSFMLWSNNHFSPDSEMPPSRLILDVTNPADQRIGTYLEEHNYELEDNNLDAEKTTYFLKLMVTLVMGVGVVISALSFYVLLLSIYLLVQKNTTKLQNLLLIGYSPSRVALPYQMLTLVLNLAVLVASFSLLLIIRGYYIDIVETLFPDLPSTGVAPTLGIGLALFLFVTGINFAILWRKTISIWRHGKN
ncbi:MAG: ABC transporter permease [Prevotella conceptionensis]